MTDYLLGIDQGSSHSKAILVSRDGKIVGRESIPIETVYPKAGWVEQDPNAILRTQIDAVAKVLRKFRRPEMRICGMGIANQRSTLIFWDKRSGRPLTPALSWRDIRTSETIKKWARHRDLIRSRTGLRLAPYYSASKMKWLLDHTKGLRGKVEKGNALCGTINTFLIWHFTRGEVYATDPTNAARTLLLNLNRLDWDPRLLTLFDVPSNLLCPVFPTVWDYGRTKLFGMDIPIKASIGDQQAGLLGVGATTKGEALINYGTGGFLLVNCGASPIRIKGLLSSLAWSTPDEKSYLIEGTVNTVGTLFDWMKEVCWVKSFKEIDQLARHPLKLPGDLIFVPSFSGLGAPHWQSGVGTAVFGIKPTTGRRELVRAAVEGISFLVRDISEAIRTDGRIRIKSLTAGGGGSTLKSLGQAQSDILGLPIRRSDGSEATAAGGAILAGVGCGWWRLPSKIPKAPGGKQFYPAMPSRERNERYEQWKHGLQTLTRLAATERRG